MINLRFGGYVWCNIEVALRYMQATIEPLDLTIVEWYKIDSKFTQQFSQNDLQAFQQVIESLQSLAP